MSNFLFLTTLRNCKVRAAKDHGKRFRSGSAPSFSGIDDYAKDGGPGQI